MMKITLLLAIFIIIFVRNSNAQETLSYCGSQFQNADSIPDYLKEDWGLPYKTINIAIVYVDFPDGRYINGSDTLQPFYDSELSLIQNKDAGAEIGIEKSNNIFLLKASKYTYYDRWNMFFSEGIYYGNVHPDWVSQGDSAFGSFKEYWTEVSNNKIRINPFITHPNEFTQELRTGIINNYEIISNGRYIIKSILLPLKKYGDSDNNSYFRNVNNTDAGGFLRIGNQTINRLKDLYLSGEIGFNYNSFLSQGGKIIILFAGGANAVSGLGGSVVRSRNFPVLNSLSNIDTLSRIDGISVSCHEFGHDAMNWNHTNSGRYCIMNSFNVWDKDCPSHPNPVYKMLKGWIRPITFDKNTNIKNLPPVETSDSCAVITIYGKPSAAPDYSSGESYVIENRRRLKFDSKIIRKQELEPYSGFEGGLLVWQYSSFVLTKACSDDIQTSIKLITPNAADSLLCSSRGYPPHFFAYLPFSQVQDPKFYKLDTTRTISGPKIKTGMELDSIKNQFGNPNGNIGLKLNYKISEPPQYSYIIYNRGLNIPNSVVNLSGYVYYHQFNNREFYKVNPGTTFDFASINNFTFVGGIEASGTETQNINFRGAGFSNQSVNYRYEYPGILFNSHAFGEVDSLILKNIKLENVKPNILDISINQSTNTPVILSNITIPYNVNSEYFDIEIKGSKIFELNLSNVSAHLFQNEYNCSPKFDYCFLSFTGTHLFSQNTELDLNNSFIRTDSNFINIIFDVIPNNIFWKGIKINGGGIYFDKYANYFSNHQKRINRS